MSRPAPGAALDPFIPSPDVRERHAITVRAPAAFVFDVARGFDMQSIPAVRFIFRTRERMLGAKGIVERRPAGIVEETLALGWGRLAEEPGRLFVAGAACRPWEPDVAFSPIAPERFQDYAEPDRVKIAWSLESEAIESDRTRFATETRAVATDVEARRKFLLYWRAFGVGILMIRWLLLPAVRGEAERRWRAGGATGVADRG